MSNQVLSAVFALALGAGVCLLLFVPFVWARHRRRGRLTLGDTLTGAAAVVYGWAIWTYTLLPLPSGPQQHCVGVNLDPLAMFGEIRDAMARGGVWLLDGAVLQLVFNVVLFVPLGFFLRMLWGRGVVIAALAGLGVSLMVEGTQLTGIWGIYPCAYRVFDVDDLILNTSGAVLGSVLSLLVPLAWRLSEVSPTAELPRPVTRSRRLLAMACDALAYTFLSLGSLAAVQLTLNTVTGSAEVGTEVAVVVSTVVPAAVSLAVVLITGGSIGDHAVRLRYVGGGQPELVGRGMRWLGGIGGVACVGLIPLLGPLGSLAATILAVVLAFTTHDGRGLPGLLSGRHLVDARRTPTAERPRAGVSLPR